MSNVDVNKIYESELKFEYQPFKDKYDDILKEGKSKYQQELIEMVEVKCIRNYTDIQLGEYKTINSEPYFVSKARARELEEKKLIKIIKEN